MTFDREKHDKRGRKFMDDGCCYIHIEAKDGRCQTQCSGEIYTIMVAVYDMLRTLSIKSNVPLIALIMTLHDIYDEFDKKEVKKKNGTD